MGVRTPQELRRESNTIDHTAEPHPFTKVKLEITWPGKRPVSLVWGIDGEGSPEVIGQEAQRAAEGLAKWLQES